MMIYKPPFIRVVFRWVFPWFSHDFHGVPNLRWWGSHSAPAAVSPPPWRFPLFFGTCFQCTWLLILLISSGARFFLAVWKICLGQHFRINGQNIFPKCFVNHVPNQHYSTLFNIRYVSEPSSIDSTLFNMDNQHSAMACHHHVPVPATKAYLPSAAGLVWHRMPFIAKIGREWEQAGLCAPEGYVKPTKEVGLLRLDWILESLIGFLNAKLLCMQIALRLWPGHGPFLYRFSIGCPVVASPI